MIAAIYVRVSTDEQAEHGYSLPHQREQCRQRAGALGASEISEFADEGVSGELLGRPGLTALRAAVRRRAVDLVVVCDPDRLARKLAHQLLVTDEIEAAKVRLEFVNFEWKNTPEGQLFYALRGAVAEFEKAKIRERTMSGRRQKAKAGRLPTGFSPYGYLYDRQGQTLVVHPSEADIVRRMFHLLVEDGVAINGIAERLTREGIPTRRGAPAWHRVVVRQILRNPVYAGTFYANRMNTEGMALNRHLPPGQRRAMRLRPREEWVPVPVPALVDDGLWRRAQEVLGQARRLMHAGPRSDYLLSGLLTCGVCGLPMCGTRRQHWGTPVRGYTCRRAWSGAKNPGCGRFVPADRLERAIWSSVAEWMADPESVARAAAAEGPAGLGERARVELEGVEQALRGAERGRRNILAALERNIGDTGECMDALGRIRERLDLLHARRRELHQTLSGPQGRAPGLLRAQVGQWLKGGALDALPLQERRQLVRHLVAGVAVHEGALVVRARIPSSAAGSGKRDGDPHAPARDAQDPP